MKNRMLFLIFLLSYYSKIDAQTIINAESLSYEAIIIDSTTSNKLPYCTIYNQTKNNGTVSNLNGIFTLNQVALNDIIIISFIGYEKKTIQLTTDALLLKKIQLTPKTELLDVITVYANNSFLYDLVSNCKKNNLSSKKTAKTYYLLKSSVNNKQVEQVESYYNGDYLNCDLSQLKLKNGRIALSDFNNRFLTSSESSKTMSLHKTFYNNKIFPVSPLGFKRKKLIKTYNLSLISMYKDENSHTVFVIKYIPKKDNPEAFNGTIWIDSLTNNLLKVSYKIENTKTHPFLKHGHIDSLINVDLALSKSYHIINNQSFIKSIDFNYSIKYKTIKDSVFIINTKALLYAYNYKDSFLLPKFTYQNSSYIDYRQINASPYNHFFWNNINEFKINELTKNNSKYIQEESKITSENLFVNNSFFKYGIHEHPYKFWSKNRITFRDESVDSKYLTNKTPSELYNLDVQIYLDVNKLNDSINHITATIFDPITSFYYYPITNQDLAFINMYFDLVEIFRIELEQEISNINDIDLIMNTYSSKMEKLKETSHSFFKDVEHGTNEEKMKKWNTYIINNLGIDNLSFFKLK